jgi:hypothetical protein
MIRLVESAIIGPDFPKQVSIDTALREKIVDYLGRNKLEESAAKLTAWEVPISVFDQKNANGRVYPKALWENVINNQRHIWEGSPMLADHPSGNSDGTPANICGVWIGARLGEGTDKYVYGTFVPSGRLGEDLQDHLAKGLRAGTSSSGFGELMHDKYTVDPSTYIIERLSDWVLTPSQGTYFKYDSVKNETKNASDSERLGESANNRLNVVEEKKTMTKLSKLEEKRVRKDVMEFLESASNLTNPQDRLNEFQDILDSLEEGACPDLREQTIAKIEEEKAKINELLKESLELKEAIKAEGSLKEKVEGMQVRAAVLQEESQDWKKVAVSLQERLNKTRELLEASPSEAYVGFLRGKLSKVYASNKALKESLAEKEVKITEALNKVKLVEASVKKNSQALQGNIERMLVEKDSAIESLERQVERLQKQYSEAESEVTRIANEFKEYRRKIEAIPLIDNPSARVRASVTFKENEAISNYWNDLVGRHGDDILEYKDRITAGKTLRECQTTYFKILPFLNEGADYSAARIPESVAIDPEDRAQLFENLGARIEPESFVKRLPNGWV